MADFSVSLFRSCFYSCFCVISSFVLIITAFSVYHSVCSSPCLGNRRTQKNILSRNCWTNLTLTMGTRSLFSFLSLLLQNQQPNRTSKQRISYARHKSSYISHCLDCAKDWPYLSSEIILLLYLAQEITYTETEYISAVCARQTLSKTHLLFEVASPLAPPPSSLLSQ